MGGGEASQINEGNANGNLNEEEDIHKRKMVDGGGERIRSLISSTDTLLE